MEIVLLQPESQQTFTACCRNSISPDLWVWRNPHYYLGPYYLADVLRTQTFSVGSCFQANYCTLEKSRNFGVISKTTRTHENWFFWNCYYNLIFCLFWCTRTESLNILLLEVQNIQLCNREKRF